MILQNNYNHFKRKVLSFKGGGSDGDTYDAAYNARMATIAESQQGMAEEYFQFWQDEYQPMEMEQIAANRELIPYETALSKEKIQAEQELLPGQVALGKAQTDSALELLPGQTALTQAQIDDTMTGIAEKAPVRTAFFDEALNGVDVESQANKAAAEASHAFMNSNSIMRRNAARMGLNPNSGAFAGFQNTNSLNRAKTVASAKTQARENAENEKFDRLNTAMGY